MQQAIQSSYKSSWSPIQSKFEKVLLLPTRSQWNYTFSVIQQPPGHGWGAQIPGSCIYCSIWFEVGFWFWNGWNLHQRRQGLESRHSKPNKENLRGIPEDFFGRCQSRVRVPTKGQQKEWRKRISQLWSYKAIHGHTNVWKKDDPKLERFVRRQREHWRLKQTNKYSMLSDEQERCLLKMGFDFDLHMTRWNQMIDKLVEHQKRYHTLSITRQMPVLLAWVLYQLSTYKLKRVWKKRKTLFGSKYDRLFVGYWFCFWSEHTMEK